MARRVEVLCNTCRCGDSNFFKNKRTECTRKTRSPQRNRSRSRATPDKRGASSQALRGEAESRATVSRFCATLVGADAQNF